MVERAAKSFRIKAEAIGAHVETHFFDVGRDELLDRLTKRNADLPPETFTVSEAELDLWTLWYELPTPEEIEQNFSPAILLSTNFCDSNI